MLHIYFFSNPTSYPSTIGYMSTYSYTFAGTPVIESVIMGERTLTKNTDYTYTDGTLTIPDVTGNLVIQSQHSPDQLIVTFDIDGSTTNTIVNSGETVQKPIDPQKNEYQFIGWYDSNDVEFDFSTPVTQDMTLHAKWEPTEYKYDGPRVFDGTDYIDTEMHLFSERNIHKNFEISFEISDVAANQKNQATIVNSMEEVSPYPGFVFRIQTNGTQLEFNAPKIANKQGININTTNKIMMKRINDIYYIQVNDGTLQQLGTYSYGKTFNVPLVLGASPDVGTLRYFVGTLSNINIRLWESENYTVIFNANGGTGTMANQIIRENETISLSANTFEKENEIFDGWNTEPDGSGTQYTDKQVVTNLASINESITLYAQWVQDVPYSVRFNSNGGTGTMPNQEFVYGTAQNLSNNTFTNENGIFMKWNTKPDGSGTYYSAGQSVKNLTKTENDIVDLYAIWSVKSYTKDQYVFDGTNYIDTGVYLFEEGTIDKDFEISFEIISQEASQKNQATFVNAMDETGSPWPGIVYRFKSGTTDHQIGANVTTSNKVETNYSADITKVAIKRVNSVIYIKLDDGDFETVLDMSALDKTFHVPLTFGASLTGKGTPQRQFKGTLANLKVTVYE